MVWASSPANPRSASLSKSNSNQSIHAEKSLHKGWAAVTKRPSKQWMKKTPQKGKALPPHSLQGSGPFGRMSLPSLPGTHFLLLYNPREQAFLPIFMHWTSWQTCKASQNKRKYTGQRNPIFLVMQLSKYFLKPWYSKLCASSLMH